MDDSRLNLINNIGLLLYAAVNHGFINTILIIETSIKDTMPVGTAASPRRNLFSS